MTLTRHRGEGATVPGDFREAFVAQPMERRIPIRRHVCGYVYSGEQWRRIGIRLSIRFSPIYSQQKGNAEMG